VYRPGHGCRGQAQGAHHGAAGGGAATSHLMPLPVPDGLYRSFIPKATGNSFPDSGSFGMWKPRGVERDRAIKVAHRQVDPWFPDHGCGREV
jgi:hypothetical protein